MAYDSGLSASDVKEIFDTGLSDGAVDTWISVAETEVGDLPSHDKLDSARKKEITKFLAAALATAQDPRVDREKHDSATVSYGGERMSYMDIASMLDPTSSIGSGPSPTIGTLEVKPYDDERATTDRDSDGDPD